MSSFVFRFLDQRVAAVHPKSLARLTRLCALAVFCAAVPAASHAERILALSADGTMRMLADPDCTGPKCRWIGIDKNPRSIALAATAEILFQLHDNGTIWMWKGGPCTRDSCPHWTRIDNNGDVVAIAANTHSLFKLHRNGEIWRVRGDRCAGGACPPWEMLDNNPRTKALAVDGSYLFQMQDTGEIWRWKGAACGFNGCPSWERLDNNPRTRQIVAAAGQLYQRHEGGAIFRWEGQPCSESSCPHWEMLDRNPRTKTIVAAPGDLYQLHDGGAIWRWKGSACTASGCASWEMLDNNPRTRAIVAGEQPSVSDLPTGGIRRRPPLPLYQVHEDGAVWRWLGAPCSGARCESWHLLSGLEIFSRYATNRGGLYLFPGEPRFGTPEIGLQGIADLHTHPMSHLGFGHKAMHGAPDIDIILPASTALGCDVPERRAKTMAEALGNCNATHGGWGVDNGCGDHLRAAIINNALDSGFWHTVGIERNLHNDHPHDGHPNFTHWPHHSSVLHQQMWWEWLRRAYEGGLRVMVALTVNSETLAEVLNGDGPFDDMSVANLQIAETKRFVEQHSDFMEIALSAEHAERIIRSNRLAVILGMEVDKLGNFGKPGVPTNATAVRAEIRRLHRLGVRYVFPIHLIDNAFGGAAVYDMLFNMANRNQNGHFFSIVSDPRIEYRADFVSDSLGTDSFVSHALYNVLETFGQIPMPMHPQCFDLVKCNGNPLPCVAGCGSYSKVKEMLRPTFQFDVYKDVPTGHVNEKSLTPLGEIAINEMMKLGMIIDVDHMSERSMRRTFDLADAVPGDYPLVMGHNGVRGNPGNERGAPRDLVRRIARLGGMMGAGTADTNPGTFVRNFNATWTELVGGGGDPNGGYLGLGTDVNGFEPLPNRTFERGLPDRVTSVPGDAWNHPPARLSCTGEERIHVRGARIGCLDIQRIPNLTAQVASACNAQTTCAFKAPAEDEYRRLGVIAATRTHCTQGMEIVYRCGERIPDSTEFYSDFFARSGISSKQLKPNGQEWDYIAEGGVSHYGLLPEFLHEVRQNDPEVYERLMGSAGRFVKVWAKAERVSRSVP